MRHAKIEMSRDCFCYAFLHKYWRQNFAWKVEIWTELLQVGSKLGMWPIFLEKKNKTQNIITTTTKDNFFKSNTEPGYYEGLARVFPNGSPCTIFYFVIIFNCSKNNPQCCTDA